MEQSVCTGAPIEPIVLEYGGDGVTTIEQGQKYMVPEKGNTIQGWRNDGLGFNNNEGTRQCTIDGTISGTSKWLSANLTGSVTYNMTIRTVGGATNAEAIIQITIHPQLNEHQIKLVSTNCSQPANAAIVVMPGREPGTPPYKAKTSDMADWVDITDVCYVQEMTFADGSPAFTGNLPAFYHIITSEAEVERIRDNWDISIMDSNGCVSGDPLQPNNIPTVDELDGQDITYTGQEYFDSKEENCKISITVHSAAAWRFTDPGDPDNMVANYPIVYVLKKKNENSGIFEETDRKWTTADMADITFPDLEAGTYAVSTAFYDNPGNPDDKPWSNCTYDIPYGEPNGSVYEKDIAITGTPEVFDLTAPYGNGYCDDGTGSGADLQLSGSESGTDYQLYKDNSQFGNPVDGTGSAIDFGKQPEGTYTVIASKSGCDADMAGEITITKKDAPAAPVINIPDGGLSYCKDTDGAEIVVTNAVNGVTYTLYMVESSSDTQIAQEIASTDGSLSLGKHTAGTYKVIATNDLQCSSERAEGNFTITELPLPDAPVIGDINGNELGYCADNTDGAEVIVTNAINGVTYTLYKVEAGGDTQVAQITATADGSLSLGKHTEGEYKVVATNASECSSENAEGTIEIKAIPLPEKPGLTATYAACQNDTETKDLNELIHDKPDGYTVTWYDSNMDPLSDTNISLKDAGTQTLYATYTNTSGCESEKATIDIVVGANSAVPVVTDYDECAKEGILDLNSLVTLNRDGLHWFDSGMTPLDDTKTSIKKDEIGTSTYYVYNVDASGCKSATVEVMVNIKDISAAPTVNTDYVEDGTFKVCAGESQSATLTTFVQNGEALNLTWYKDAGLTETIPADEVDLDLSVAQDVTYYVTNTEDGLCESLPVLLRIVVNAVPSAPVAAEDPDNAGYAYNECAIVGSKSLSELIVSHDGTLQWYDAAGNPLGTGASFDTSEAGETTYYASSISADGCESAKAEVKVRVLAAGVAPDVLDYNECAQEGTYNLDNLATTPQGTLEWFGDASATQLLSPATFDMAQVGNHTYYVRATASGECHSGVVPVSVVIRDVATASDISVDDLDVCPGAEATLTASTSMDDVNMVFTWYSDAELGNSISTGATLQITGPDAQATYYVTVKGDNTCENLPGDAAEAAVYAIAPIDNVRLQPVEERIGMGKETEKALTVEPTDAYYTAVWTANGQVIADPDSYFPAKPYDDVEYKVVVTDECGNEMEASAITKVVWPTIITPQNADGKNDDFLVGMQEDIHLEIFDRWGNVVFSGNDGWSQAEAAKQQPGVYYYIATLPDGTAKQGTIEVYK